MSFHRHTRLQRDGTHIAEANHLRQLSPLKTVIHKLQLSVSCQRLNAFSDVFSHCVVCAIQWQAQCLLSCIRASGEFTFSAQGSIILRVKDVLCSCRAHKQSRSTRSGAATIRASSAHFHLKHIYVPFSATKAHILLFNLYLEQRRGPNPHTNSDSMENKLAFIVSAFRVKSQSRLHRNTGDH